jgi:hypothetical protein
LVLDLAPHKSQRRGKSGSKRAWKTDETIQGSNTHHPQLLAAKQKTPRPKEARDQEEQQQQEQEESKQAKVHALCHCLNFL